MKRYTIICCTLLGSFLSFTQAQDFSKYQKEIFIQEADTLEYRVLWPDHFSKDKQYPVVLFLHGAGERGNDNTSQLIHGSKLFSDLASRKQYPAIVIFPQCPKEDYWSNAHIDRSKTGRAKYQYLNGGQPHRSLKLVMQLMDEIVAKPYTKDDQIYVGGLSMGGMGTFEIVYRKPEMFAAAFPICGGGHPETANYYASKTAMWIFHGAKDKVVDPSFSEDMAQAIQKAGGNSKLTMYKDAHHNSWDRAFAESQLLPWLFSHRKQYR